jgi:hypothetical protein
MISVVAGWGCIHFRNSLAMRGESRCGHGCADQSKVRATGGGMAREGARGRRGSAPSVEVYQFFEAPRAFLAALRTDRSRNGCRLA